MTTHFSTTTRNGKADALIADLGNAGTIKFYTGTLPADGDTDPAGTLLATVVLGSPAAPAASAGVATFTNPAGVTVATSGTPTVAAFEDSIGTNVAVMEVGAGKEITLDNYNLVAGGTLDMGTITYTEAATV